MLQIKGHMMIRANLRTLIKEADTIHLIIKTSFNTKRYTARIANSDIW